MGDLTCIDMVGNVLHIGDKIIFHTKKFGSCFDVSVVENIEKDVEQTPNQYIKVRSDKVYFKQKRSTGSYMIYKPSNEVIKLIREEE